MAPVGRGVGRVAAKGGDVAGKAVCAGDDSQGSGSSGRTGLARHRALMRIAARRQQDGVDLRILASGRSQAFIMGQGGTRRPTMGVLGQGQGAAICGTGGRIGHLAGRTRTAKGKGGDDDGARCTRTDAVGAGFATDSAPAAQGTAAVACNCGGGHGDGLFPGGRV